MLYKWLKEGNVKAGDEVVLTVTGLCNANDESDKYNGNGVLTVKYIAGALPAELVSVANSPEEMNFLSYYLPTDERGVVTLTFKPFDGRRCYGKIILWRYRRFKCLYGKSSGEGERYSVDCRPPWKTSFAI